MKKSLLFLSCATFMMASMNAQVTISNGSFETWGSSSVSWQRPGSWSGTDEILKTNELLLVVGGFASFGSVNQQMFKETDAANVHEGASSVKLVSKDLGGTLGVTPCLMANGALELDLGAAMAGEIDGLESVVSVTGGTVMMGRKADSVVFYVKGGDAILNEDSSIIIVQAKRKMGDSLVTIGGGEQLFNGRGEFKKIVVNVDYLSATATATDTFVIFVMSSASIPTGDTSTGMFGATENNTIFIDDMTIYTSEGSTSSINNVKTTDLGVNVYPNPATTFINFNNTQVKEAVINIYDVSGRIMHQATVGMGITNLDISKYANGTYFYEFLNIQTQQKQSGQFVK